MQTGIGRAKLSVSSSLIEHTIRINVETQSMLVYNSKAQNNMFNIMSLLWAQTDDTFICFAKHV